MTSKMPEMPKWDTSCAECGWSLSEAGITRHAQACFDAGYFAGLAAAKEAVPDAMIKTVATGYFRAGLITGHNECTELMRNKLDTLIKGAAHD